MFKLASLFAIAAATLAAPFRGFSNPGNVQAVTITEQQKRTSRLLHAVPESPGIQWKQPPPKNQRQVRQRRRQLRARIGARRAAKLVNRRACA